MHETSKHATTFDRDERDKDDGLRVMAADIAPTALPQSAESVAIYQSDENFAERVLSDMAIEKELVHGARAQGLKVRARRQSEKAAYLSRAFRRKVGLPRSHSRSWKLGKRCQLASRKSSLLSLPPVQFPLRSAPTSN